MLTIKCAGCKNKVMKYKKIGKGKVLKCWESKIKKLYDAEVKENKLRCKNCGKIIGDVILDNNGDNYVNMDSNSFIFTGTKVNN